MIKRLTTTAACLLIATVAVNATHTVITASDIFGKLAVISAALTPLIVPALAVVLVIALATTQRRTALALAATLIVALLPFLAPIYPNTTPQTASRATTDANPILTFAFANMYRGATRKRDIHFLTAGPTTPDIVMAAETHYTHQRKVSKILHKTHRHIRLTGRFGTGETLSVWLKRKSHWTLTENPYTPLGARVFRLTLAHKNNNPQHTTTIIGLHAHHPISDTIAAWNHDLAATTALIKTSTGPLLIAGDFNQPLTSHRLALWATTNKLTSCRTPQQILTKGTWATPQAPTKPLISIDHIFTRNAHCGPVRVLRLSRSDHRGLVGTITT